jgi:hypothetical protein
MSAHQEIVSEPFAFVARGPARGRGALGRRLRSQVWIARLATVWGFAGAVLVQTAVFGLVGRLALQIDSTALPGLAASLIGLALGALAMVGSRSVTAQPRLAA